MGIGFDNGIELGWEGKTTMRLWLLVQLLVFVLTGTCLSEAATQNESVKKARRQGLHESTPSRQRKPRVHCSYWQIRPPRMHRILNGNVEYIQVPRTRSPITIPEPGETRP